MLKGIVLAGLMLMVGQFPTVPFVRNYNAATPPAYTVIQSVVSSTDGTFVTSITPGATGRLLSVVASVGACTASSATISDTAGNAWTVDKNFYDSIANTWLVIHALSNGTSATTITLAPGTTCPHGGLAVAEVSGVSLIDSPSITAASSSSVSYPTLVMTTNHSGEFCAIIGNLATFTPSFSTIKAISNPVFGGTQMVGGPSTGTSTTFASTIDYANWVLAGACYK